jgi:hypothetical protein
VSGTIQRRTIKHISCVTAGDDFCLNFMQIAFLVCPTMKVAKQKPWPLTQAPRVQVNSRALVLFLRGADEGERFSRGNAIASGEVQDAYRFELM